MRVIRSDDSQIILSLIRAGVNVNLQPRFGVGGTVEGPHDGTGPEWAATRKHRSRKPQGSGVLGALAVEKRSAGDHGAKDLDGPLADLRDGNETAGDAGRLSPKFTRFQCDPCTGGIFAFRRAMVCRFTCAAHWLSTAWVRPILVTSSERLVT